MKKLILIPSIIVLLIITFISASAAQTVSDDLTGQGYFSLYDFVYITGTQINATEFCFGADCYTSMYDLEFSGDTGSGIITDSEIFAIESGSGASTVASGNTVTVTVGAGTGLTQAINGLFFDTTWGDARYYIQATIDSFIDSLNTSIKTKLNLSDTFSGDIGGTYDATVIQANSVALGTDTVGNYVETVSSGDGITVTGADAEGSTKTVSIDATTCETGNYTYWSGTAWLCRDDESGGAGIGASGGVGIEVNVTGNVSILLSYQVPQGCNDGEIAEYNTTSSGWDCAIDNSASSGMADWVLAASDSGGSETITDGETVTFGDDSKYLTATRITNTIYYSIIESVLNITIMNVINGSSLNLTNSFDYGGSVTESQISDFGTYLTSEVDGSITNELQDLWDTISSDSGSTTANTNTDTLTIAGAGIASTAISGDTLTITVTEVDGSTTNELQNIFQTINPTSGTSPVADSTTDTLNIVASTGITVTGDSGTDSITIASTIVDTTQPTYADQSELNSTNHSYHSDDIKSIFGNSNDAYIMWNSTAGYLDIKVN